MWMLWMSMFWFQNSCECKPTPQVQEMREVILDLKQRESCKEGLEHLKETQSEIWHILDKRVVQLESYRDNFITFASIIISLISIFVCTSAWLYINCKIKSMIDKLISKEFTNNTCVLAEMVKKGSMEYKIRTELKYGVVETGTSQVFKELKRMKFNHVKAIPLVEEHQNKDEYFRGLDQEFDLMVLVTEDEDLAAEYAERLNQGSLLVMTKNRMKRDRLQEVGFANSRMTLIQRLFEMGNYKLILKGES